MRRERKIMSEDHQYLSESGFLPWVDHLVAKILEDKPDHDKMMLYLADYANNRKPQVQTSPDKVLKEDPLPPLTPGTIQPASGLTNTEGAAATKAAILECYEKADLALDSACTAVDTALSLTLKLGQDYDFEGADDPQMCDWAHCLKEMADTVVVTAAKLRQEACHSYVDRRIRAVGGLDGLGELHPQPGAAGPEDIEDFSEVVSDRYMDALKGAFPATEGGGMEPRVSAIMVDGDARLLVSNGWSRPNFDKQDAKEVAVRSLSFGPSWKDKYMALHQASFSGQNPKQDSLIGVDGKVSLMSSIYYPVVTPEGYNLILGAAFTFEGGVTNTKQNIVNSCFDQSPGYVTAYCTHSAQVLMQNFSSSRLLFPFIKQIHTTSISPRDPSSIPTLEESGFGENFLPHLIDRDLVGELIKDLADGKSIEGQRAQVTTAPENFDSEGSCGTPRSGSDSDSAVPPLFGGSRSSSVIGSIDREANQRTKRWHSLSIRKVTTPSSGDSLATGSCYLVSELDITTQVLLEENLTKSFKQIRKDKEEIVQARERADGLVSNMLPQKIIEKLRVEKVPNVISEKYPDTTLLFSDIAGFTSWSSRTSVDHVVDSLHHFISSVDEIAALSGVEKIKTIGDCYFAATGCPSPDVASTTPVFCIDREVLNAKLWERRA